MSELSGQVKKPTWPLKKFSKLMSATTNKLQIYNQLKLSVLGSLASMLPWWRILMICTIRKVLILIKVSSKPKEIDFAITKLSALISKPHCWIWQRWTHLIELPPSSFATGWKTTRLRYQILTHSFPTKFLDAIETLKSPILAPSSLRKILAGFRSRWTILLSCMVLSRFIVSMTVLHINY